MDRRVLVGFRGNVNEFYFNKLETAHLFTCIDEGCYIHAKTMDGLKVVMNPDEIETVIVLDEFGEIEFDSRNNFEASFVDDEGFDTEGYFKEVEQIEIELDTIEKLAAALEKKYPFVKVSIDFEVDEDKIENFVAAFKG
ncbi:hypothetical protein NSQ77_19915 [Oceanobacillus sp. FSL K6-2867]|uniref:hypothetical protein n=1 Tax=Oceanobacillus sp. FSL K6-2867 TaxID=2954748 RepID=UPI0030DC0807